MESNNFRLVFIAQQKRLPRAVASGQVARQIRRGSVLAVALWALVVQLILPHRSQAAAPANDFCGGAETIAPAGPFPYWTATTDIAEATSDGDPPYPTCAFGGLGRTVWYTFTPAVSAKYTFTTCREDITGTTVYDTLISIYASAGGCAGPFAELFCNDDACGFDGLQSRVTGQLVGGVTYYVVVWEYASLTYPGTALQMRIDRTLPPANDTCAAAPPLTLNIPTYGTTTDAFDDYQLSVTETNCFSGLGQSPSPAIGRDVVYRFTAPAAGSYSFRVFDYANSGRNLVLYLVGSCPAGPSPAVATNCLAAANRSSASSAEEIPCFPMAAGQQIFIIVDEQVPTEGSTFHIEVTSCVREMEPNNDFPGNTFTPICGIQGSITNVGLSLDLDVYSLGAPAAGSRVFALVDGVAASIQGSGQDFDLRVITDTETLEFDNNANSTQFGTSAPNIAGTILNGAPAYLAVDNIFTASEPYRLYAVVQPNISLATAEGTNRHDTITTARTAKNNYFSGTATNGEVDVYGFTAAVGELIFVSLDGDPTRDNTPVNTRLELLDYCGNVLVMVDSPRNNSITNQSCPGLECPDYPGEGLVYRARRPGNYFARVTISPSASPAAGSGDYLLSITKNCVLVNDRNLYAPPILSNLTVSSPVAEGSPASVSGTVTDPNTNGIRNVNIAWGDGATHTVVLAPGVNNFNASHPYPANTPPGTPTNNYPVNLTITGSFSCLLASTNINVFHSPRPTIKSITPQLNGHFLLQIKGTPGVAYRIVATNALDSNMSLWPTAGITTIADGAGMCQWEDMSPGPLRTFYGAVSP